MVRRLIVVVCMAVVAGVAVTAALSWTDTYCDGCTLPSNGTPAVSGTAYHLSNYEQITSGSFGDLHVYFYNTSTGNQTCDLAVNNQNWIYRGGCSNYATARCHLLHGTGPFSGCNCHAGI
jgi:hypothetical protein